MERGEEAGRGRMNKNTTFITKEELKKELQQLSNEFIDKIEEGVKIGRITLLIESKCNPRDWTFRPVFNNVSPIAENKTNIRHSNFDSFSVKQVESKFINQKYTAANREFLDDINYYHISDPKKTRRIE